MILSLDPETNKLSCQCKLPIHEELMYSSDIVLFFSTSVIIIYPFESDIDKWVPSLSKDNEQT